MQVEQHIAEGCAWRCGLQVKERLKKTRQDKAVLKATDAKKGGGKAPKSTPARAVAKGARR